MAMSPLTGCSPYWQRPIPKNIRSHESYWNSVYWNSTGSSARNTATSPSSTQTPLNSATDTANRHSRRRTNTQEHVKTRIRQHARHPTNHSEVTPCAKIVGMSPKHVEDMYDAVIVGAGAAGLSAALGMLRSEQIQEQFSC